MTTIQGGFTMIIGERIKRIRTFRNFTQGTLGEALGFEPKNAAVRIAQYESNYRAPKDDMILQMADILNIHPACLRNLTGDTTLDLIESLFWLEEEKGYEIINLTELGDVYKDSEVSMTYNEAKRTSTISPISLIFQDETLNFHMFEWNKKKQELASGKITKEEYFQWKITWPHA